MKFYKFVQVAACVSIAISGLKLISPYGFALNYTESIPRGLYLKVDYPTSGLVRNALACFYYDPPPWAVERKYAAPGQEFCKPVAGLPGDRVTVAEGKLVIEQRSGRRVQVPIRSQDSKGRPLPTALVSGEVPQGKLLFLTEHVPNSLDSRHLGLIDAKRIKHLAYPVLTE